MLPSGLLQCIFVLWSQISCKYQHGEEYWACQDLMQGSFTYFTVKPKLCIAHRLESCDSHCNFYLGLSPDNPDFRGLNDIYLTSDKLKWISLVCGLDQPDAFKFQKLHWWLTNECLQWMNLADDIYQTKNILYVVFSFPVSDSSLFSPHSNSLHNYKKKSLKY